MSKDNNSFNKIGHTEMLEMKRWNTPAIFNGWEQITDRNSPTDCFNLEECKTVIAAARNTMDKSTEKILENINKDANEINTNNQKKFHKRGEW